MQRFQQAQRLAFPECSFIVQRRENEPAVFEPTDGVEDLMGTAERQYRDMEAMTVTRGAVEGWSVDAAESAVGLGGHGHLREVPDQSTTPNYNDAWEHHPQQQPQHQHPPLIPYTMHTHTHQQAQHQYPPPPMNPNYDPPFYPSSTDSTPPSGFYINTNAHHLPHAHTYPGPQQILSPTSSTSTTDPDSEQKRQRNTAASARFRAKKKRREQSLERASTEKRQQVQRLEKRVGELEEENRWLKDLVWERGSVRERKEKELREREGRDEKEEDMGKKEGERNDGVGTN